LSQTEEKPQHTSATTTVSFQNNKNSSETNHVSVHRFLRNNRCNYSRTSLNKALNAFLFSATPSRPKTLARCGQFPAHGPGSAPLPCRLGPSSWPVDAPVSRIRGRGSGGVGGGGGTVFENS